MSGKVTKKEVEKEITFLHDATVSFVSLVKHGANKQAFRIIKQEGGGSENMDKVIQSILLSNDLKMENLSSIDGLGYLTEAKTDEVIKFDNYNKYIQTNEKKFEKDSLSLVKLDKCGYAIVGKLKEDADDKNVLILGISKDDKTKSHNAGVMNEPVPSSGVMMTDTFGELFHRELSLFLDIIFGVLRQSSTDAKKRKQTVMGAFESFKNFVSIGLDSIGKAKVDVGKVDLNKSLTKMEDVVMTKEEILQIVKESFTGMLPGAITDAVSKSIKEVIAPITEAVDKLTKAADDVAGDEQKKSDEKLKSDVEASEKEKEELKKTVKDLKAKMDKLGVELDTQPSNSEKDDSSNQGEEDGNKNKSEKEESGIFGGLIIKTHV